MQRNNLAFYDQQAAQWWDEAATVYPLRRLNPLRFQYFDRYISTWNGLSVLDVGCGGGYTCEFLTQRGAKVWGIDQSAACIQTAQTHATAEGLAIAYKQGLAEQLPFESGQFDVVVCVDVLEHVENPKQAIAEISRVLKPGGCFCFDTINRTWQSRLVMITLLEDLLREIPRGIHDWRKFVTPDEVQGHMASAGLEAIAINGFNLFGSTVGEKFEALRHYWRTGEFRVRFDADTSIMFIGLGQKRLE
ncbi:bifunctional 2-polyprenyl-6-hydroxyphenol methylase/3-demethylubiquinol 3-O-methyltransferase UbiG [Vacuolonema iberomarrocanum]|uniref:bifunctional 2-polyprenyl-6-hydroxyphenol methylase/3-demethylubiquinol 3-O-methyltransferase UbiG n=1 Tax=Vacuolonema iberomarrocanum TaxID=3454632 RepID=UPI0019FE3B27|nr:3-demethylubiquinone-9 3-O-methyltransferase [filamentous cyanobacterium LEGE 07170]